jgi:hypothetical protein
MAKFKRRPISIFLLMSVFLASPLRADDAELAKQAQNPIAALVSLPLQLNYDEKIGPAKNGDKWVMNVQPVVPFSIGADWNLISRTIVPLVKQEDIAPGTRSDSGIGDITQSFFFSPKQPTSGGWIWGAGPVLVLPTGTKERLTADKWGIGPTAVLLKQADGWTYGALDTMFPIVSFHPDSKTMTRSAISARHH